MYLRSLVNQGGGYKYDGLHKYDGYTNMTDIRHICVFSDFNFTLLNLRVLKYKFLIVTIVPVAHILNLKK